MINKIVDRKARVAVIGLGYVGLPLVIEITKAGFDVVGIDMDEEKINRILSGQSYIRDVKSEDIYNAVKNEKLVAAADYSAISDADIIIITVPTPLSRSKIPDLSYIRKASEGIKAYFNPVKMIILESTTYPGTTRELIVNELEMEGYRLDKDFFAAYSPERVDPGNSVYNTKNTPKVVGGASEKSNELAVTFYSSVIDTVIPLENCEEAEMSKLLENTFRAVNIGFVNELAIMCDKMGINVWNVIEGAKSKPFGFMAFYPGPGIGGHCIPLDPIYLSWKAKHYGFFNRHIELATEINDNMPDFIVDKLFRIMNKHKKLLNGANVLMLGVAYKNDIDDARESPALVIYEKLRVAGSSVNYYDPYVPSFKDIYGNTVRGIESLDKEVLQRADVVLLITPHKVFNYEFIVEYANLIFDTRNVIKDHKYSKIIYL